MNTTLSYYSGCIVTDSDPTPGEWNELVFTAEDGTKWTWDGEEEDPRKEGTGTHYLIPVC